MWTTLDIDDLQIAEPSTDAGYLINIRAHLMADDLKAFVVTPSGPRRRWADDMGAVPIAIDPERPDRFDFASMVHAKPVFSTVFLVFPDLATAQGTSLGHYWQDSQ